MTLTSCVTASGSSEARALEEALQPVREVCSEIKPGDKFDEARVKLLTGVDRIKARRIRQDPLSFEPTHKLLLLGNTRPGLVTVPTAVCVAYVRSGG